MSEQSMKTMYVETTFDAKVKTITDKDSGKTEIQLVVDSDNFMDELNDLRAIRKVPLIVGIAKQQLTTEDAKKRDDSQLPLKPAPPAKPLCRDCGLPVDAGRNDPINDELVIWAILPTDGEAQGICSMCMNRRKALEGFAYPPMIPDDKKVPRCSRCGLARDEFPEASELDPLLIWQGAEGNDNFRLHRCPDVSRYIPMWLVAEDGKIAILGHLGTPQALPCVNGPISCAGCGTNPETEPDAWSVVGGVLRHRCPSLSGDAWSINPQTADLLTCGECHSLNLIFDAGLVLDLQAKELTRLLCGDCGAVLSVPRVFPEEQTLRCPKCEEPLEGVEDLFIGYSPVTTICPNADCAEEIWIAWDGTGPFEIIQKNCTTCSKEADACEHPREGECADWSVKPGEGLPVEAEIGEDTPPLSMMVVGGVLIQPQGDGPIKAKWVVLSVDPKAETAKIAPDGMAAEEAKKKVETITFADLDEKWELADEQPTAGAKVDLSAPAEEIGAEAVPEFCDRCRELVKGAECRYAGKGQSNDCPAWAEHLKSLEGANA